MSEALVAVRGEAVLEVEPEIAMVIVTVESQDKDRGRAIASLDARHRSVLDLAGEYQSAIESVESSRIHVAPQFKDERTRGKVTGHLARRTVTIRVSDFSVLGDLIGRTAADAVRELDGPFWSLRPDSPKILEARTQAVHDAVHRARAYAGALGGTITDVREIADIGLGGGSEPYRRHVGAAAVMGSSAGASESLEFDVTPVAQTVRASVEARFMMSAPDLSIIT
jgi:uncharacterized protein YggE